MIEITNKQPGPVQLIVRSKTETRGFTTQIIPGRGKGQNKILIEDEVYTDYIDRIEGLGLISTRRI